MKISNYDDYKIKVRNSYTYRNEEGDYISEIEEFEDEGYGGAIAKLIGSFLNDTYFSLIVSQENKVCIQIFDPLMGTGQDITITIEEISKKDRG